MSSSPSFKHVSYDSSGVVRLVRDEPPEHCILKVDSFSLLKDLLLDRTRDYISSTEFKAGGYTWKLFVYPNGNEEEDGEDHLSLYVALVDRLESDSSVTAALRFFIYDQIRNNYLAFIDLDDKRFQALKTTGGVAKLMPLETFTNASRGFLVNDCCIFGAEVLVRDGGITLNRSTMSLLDSKSNRIYTWKIENYSDLNNTTKTYSPVFIFGEWSWKLYIYPRGHRQSKGKYLSLYLELMDADANKLTHGSNLYTKFCLRVNNQGEGAHHKRIVRGWFHSKSTCWGYRSFLSISDVYNATNSFLVDDTVIVEVEFKETFLLKDTDPSSKKTKLEPIVTQ